MEVAAYTPRRRAAWGIALEEAGSLPAVALSASLATAVLVWNPHVRDLASHVFRAELFERYGFSIWNGSWYGGHYVLTQGALFPSLASVVDGRLIAALAVVWSAYLFDRLVRTRWGDAARPATLWYAVGAVTMLASGRLSFALGVAMGLASLRSLQAGRAWLGAAAAATCALASPVAGVFLAGVVGVAALVERPRSLAGPIAVTLAALLPVAVLNAMFAEQSQEPFSFSAWIALPLWCTAALYVCHQVPRERALRAVVAAYLAVGTVIWLVPNPMGGNVTRLGALFGGPVLAAAVLRSRHVPLRRVVLALALAGSVWWQFQGAVRDIVKSSGDPATHLRYYEPLASWLRANAASTSRIEIPFTLGHWETAYLAPEFQLARGWLRQVDRADNSLFYDGKLTNARYRNWLRENAVRYVALPDAASDYSARREHDLIAREPPYLRLRARLAHWRVYEVRGAPPLAKPIGTARGRLVGLGPNSFLLEVRRPGRFVVRVRGTPFWTARAKQGCIGHAGPWTLVRADRRGLFPASIGFSLGRAWSAATGRSTRC